ncbi:MAG: hypothetical protein ISQ13_00210 [Candidatus Margulisbacteria bacterium]|nr:hypothetical protein [Candidatus Margulisiibacteriota bacterium]|tara:strand:+ start:217 stop:471 length:255 start_codon:yes stop_codon:yes gene_type:complete
MLKSSIVIGIGVIFIGWLLHQMNGKKMQVKGSLDYPQCEATKHVVNGKMHADHYSEWLSQGCQRVMIAIVFDRQHADARVTFWR